MGMSRSASLIIAYLIKYRKINLDESIRLISKKRFIWPNDGFIEQLMQWEKKFI
jgi:protein-tyrosine phosphatase